MSVLRNPPIGRRLGTYLRVTFSSEVFSSLSSSSVTSGSAISRFTRPSLISLRLSLVLEVKGFKVNGFRGTGLDPFPGGFAQGQPGICYFIYALKKKTNLFQHPQFYDVFFNVQ